MSYWKENANCNKSVLVDDSGEILARVEYRLGSWWVGFKEFISQEAARRYAETAPRSNWL